MTKSTPQAETFRASNELGAFVLPLRASKLGPLINLCELAVSSSIELVIELFPDRPIKFQTASFRLPPSGVHSCICTPGVFHVKASFTLFRANVLFVVGVAKLASSIDPPSLSKMNVESPTVESPNMLESVDELRVL